MERFLHRVVLHNDGENKEGIPDTRMMPNLFHGLINYFTKSTNPILSVHYLLKFGLMGYLMKRRLG